MLLVSNKILQNSKHTRFMVLNATFVFLGQVIPRSNCHNFSELLLALNKVFTAEWRVWLSEILAVDGFPSNHATPEAKTKFFMKVTK